MGFWSRLFNWEAFALGVFDGAAPVAVKKAKAEIDERDGLKKSEKVLLKEGVDLAVARLRKEVEERL